MPAPDRRYKVTFKNGHFDYVMAPSMRAARIEAARRRAVQNKFNKEQGVAPMSPVDSVKRSE
jgi:excinuclease UvrABC helicase subunit UvrB